jgi:hypothetical protein
MQLTTENLPPAALAAQLGPAPPLPDWFMEAGSAAFAVIAVGDSDLLLQPGDVVLAKPGLAVAAGGLAVVAPAGGAPALIKAGPAPHAAHWGGVVGILSRRRQ